MTTVRLSEDVVITFTERGERALDALAQALVDETELTPAGIADLLERLCTTPIADLAAALRFTTVHGWASPGGWADRRDARPGDPPGRQLGTAPLPAPSSSGSSSGPASGGRRNDDVEPA